MRKSIVAILLSRVGMPIQKGLSSMMNIGYILRCPIFLSESIAQIFPDCKKKRGPFIRSIIYRLIWMLFHQKIWFTGQGIQRCCLLRI